MAVVFDGSDSILLPNITIPATSTGIVTYTFWIRVDVNTGVLQRPWGSQTHNEGRFSAGLLMVNDVYEGTLKATATTPMVVGEWFFFAFTGNANTNFHEIYVNGVSEDSAGDAIGSTLGVDVSFGTRTGTTQFLTGALDDWRMYEGRELPADEIETIFNLRGNDGIVRDLRHRFTFREGAPGDAVVSLVDVGPANDGGGGETITGNPVFEESELKFSRAA